MCTPTEQATRALIACAAGGRLGFALIAYECTAAGHQSAPDHADKLTIHQGAWAYCPFNALAAGHVWHETGGIDVDTLVRRGRRVVVSETPMAVPET